MKQSTQHTHNLICLGRKACEIGFSHSERCRNSNTAQSMMLVSNASSCAGKAEQDLIGRTEMRILRWLMGIKRIENIRNEEGTARTGVANTSVHIREARLRWLGHVERNTEEDVSSENMKCGSGPVGGHRDTGRLKLRWSNATRKHMNEKYVNIEEAKYRIKWGSKPSMRPPQLGVVHNCQHVLNSTESTNS